MGGSSKRKSTTNTTQSQSSQSQLGSTSFATPFLGQYQQAAQGAAQQGAYTGDVVAAPTQVGQYAPNVPQVSGFVADPGAPLDDYTPDVQILDRYIAGATAGGQAGLANAQNWAATQGGQVQQSAQDLGSFWQQVASGQFVDPQSNQYLQSFFDMLQNETAEDYTGAVDALRSEAISSGAYGGTAHGTAATGIADKFSENILNTRANVGYQNYLAEMARRERAGAGATDAFNLGLLPGQTQMGLGDIERGYNQLDINDTMARNQEIERGQAYDIEDQRMQRQDTALRAQAGLDNELGMAQWDIYGQQNQIQDDIMRANVDQMIRQAGLTNDMSRFDAERWGEMDAWERYFQGLANPVFGESSSGTMTGTSTTTTKESQPLWRDILGAASAAAQLYGGLTGNPAAMAAGMAGGQSGGGGSNSGPQIPTFQPIPVPQLSYGQRYFAPQGGAPQAANVPWYLQQAYPRGY